MSTTTKTVKVTKPVSNGYRKPVAKAAATKRIKLATAKSDTKKCSRCGETKPRDFEHYYINAKGGCCSMCRPCFKQGAKDKRAAKKAVMA